MKLPPFVTCLFAAAFVLFASAASASVQPVSSNQPTSGVVDEEEEVDPDTFLLPGKGKIAVVSFVGRAEPTLRQQTAEFSNVTYVATELQRASGKFCCKKARQLLRDSGASAAVFVIEDGDLPVEVVAMEDRWAFVNCAHLSDGVSPAQAEKRLRCLVTRAAGVLIGVLVPRTTNGIMVGAASLSDLDAIKTEFLTFDLLANVRNYSAKSGIVPARRMSYRNACERGTAPKPVTDYQKKVWDEYHSLPSKPIKIKYDKKLGK